MLVGLLGILRAHEVDTLIFMEYSLCQIKDKERLGEGSIAPDDTFQSLDSPSKGLLATTWVSLE